MSLYEAPEDNPIVARLELELPPAFIIAQCEKALSEGWTESDLFTELVSQANDQFPEDEEVTPRRIARIFQAINAVNN
jgi:hypothetical protein